MKSLIGYVCPVILQEIANPWSAKLVQGISKAVPDTPRSVDMLDWMGRAALEIIGKAGMGHSFDPLTSDDSSDPYTKAAKTYLCVSKASTCPTVADAMTGRCHSHLLWWP